MLAIMSQASALAMVASKSLARRRLRPSQAKVRSGVGAIGEDVAQPGEGPSDRGEQRRRTVAVLDMGGVNHAGDEPPAGVGEDMALAPLNQLAGVEPARATAFRGFHRLAVDHTGGRAGLSALGPRPSAARARMSGSWLIPFSVASVRQA